MFLSNAYGLGFKPAGVKFKLLVGFDDFVPGDLAFLVAGRAADDGREIAAHTGGNRGVIAAALEDEFAEIGDVHRETVVAVLIIPIFVIAHPDAAAVMAFGRAFEAVNAAHDVVVLGAELFGVKGKNNVRGKSKDDREMVPAVAQERPRAST